jgi:hypothetical protein
MFTCERRCIVDNFGICPFWLPCASNIAFSRNRAYCRFCIVQIVTASLYSIMVISDHPWGVTFETEFRTTSCFLAGKDWNIKNYSNHDALSQCRDSKLRTARVWKTCLFDYVVEHVCSNTMMSVYLCVLVSVRESGERERVVRVCVFFFCASSMHKGGNKNTDIRMIFHFSSFRRFLCPEAAFLFFGWFFFNRGYRKQRQRSTNSCFVDIFEVVSHARNKMFVGM